MSDSEAWATAALETTVPQLFSRNVAQFPQEPALTDGDRTLTWEQAQQEVQVLAAGLAALGLQRGQTVLIMVPNRVEHWLIDVAATHLGAVPSTLYPTLSQDQVHYIAHHSRAKIVVLDGADQLRRWSKTLRNASAIEHVAVLDEQVMVSADERFRTWDRLRALGEQRLREDPELVQRASAATNPADPAAILYTSGTTGEQKGVVLTHRNICFAAASLHQATQAERHAPRICYLPLAHIAERMVGIYAAIHDVAHVHFCADPKQLPATLARARPALFFAVPRIWEKLAAALRGIPAEQRTSQARRLRSRLGLDRATWPASGAAPIDSELVELFSTIGVDIFELWGMTETSGCATTNHAGANRPGTVGRAVPGVELRIGDDGEVLVRGPLVCAGYLEPDGVIRPAADADGWLRTGDIGVLDDDGFLSITDRKKELIISAGGKNIAPTAVENALRAHPLLGHALVFGDRRPYLVALLVLDEDAAPKWARERGISFNSLRELAEHPAVQSEVATAVAAANSRLNRPEQVKQYRVLAHSWGVEGGELTPTLKLKRRVIHEKYADIIDQLYAT
ncbi:long-chain acyl-CoA synthetase [Saccharopolyspora antimicrobica]|uniref:Acyl-CoA synthetase n=1 Tax=Saccharopolyspora antimicrobica TaxID=455193 RepID=A0A1I5ICF7_9PSEU|nr:AMP-dependent synthetase/ligase [Saccharopolyspora antimicrobica]RKT85540.1 long-chain acyl-CoA synthetase [Saccharopolyspora antimicrobica]SFO58182.1 long-chain acyl-CoA synthetase [Saccharopolyspora antimicrobica]